MSSIKNVKSLRSFGLLVGGCFTMIALFPLLRHHPVRVWALALGGVLLLGGLVAPRLLYYPWRLWMILGEALGWVNSRILLSVIFYVMITPIGMLRRALGQDTMPLRFSKGVSSYFQRAGNENPVDLERVF